MNKKIFPPRVTVLFSLAKSSPRLAKASPPAAAETAPTKGQPKHVPPADQAVPRDVQHVALALANQGFSVQVVNITDEPERLLNAITVEDPDLAFNMVSELEGTSLNNHLAPSLLDWIGVAYTGCEPLSLSTCLDRARTKIILRDAGIPVPKFAIVRDVNTVPDTPGFRLPMVITQSFDDVYETEGFQHPLYDWETIAERATELAIDYSLPFLIEEYIGYRRLHVVVLGNRSLEMLPIVETDMPEISAQPPVEHEDVEAHEHVDEHDVADEAELHTQADDVAPAEAGDVAATDTDNTDNTDNTDAAPANGESSHEPVVTATPLELGSIYVAQMEPDQADRIRGLAARAYRALGCRDFAMVDVHMDEAGKAYVTDVRPMFEMSHGHAFALAADSSDRGYDRTVAELARIALRRSGLQEAALMTERLADMAETTNGAGAPAPTPPPAEPPLQETPPVGTEPG